MVHCRLPNISNSGSACYGCYLAFLLLHRDGARQDVQGHSKGVCMDSPSTWQRWCGRCSYLGNDWRLPRRSSNAASDLWRSWLEHRASAREHTPVLPHANRSLPRAGVAGFLPGWSRLPNRNAFEEIGSALTYVDSGNRCTRTLTMTQRSERTANDQEP